MFAKWKKKKVEEQEIQIELPEESFTLLKWKENDLPCIAMLNSALKQFSHKEIFAWHLTVTIEFEKLIDNGMPSIEEREIVDPFADKLENEIKSGGNALFLIRETWNGTKCLVWRVYDPDIANQHLEYLANNFQYPRQFNWHMSHDPEWGIAKWYFEQLET